MEILLVVLLIILCIYFYNKSSVKDGTIQNLKSQVDTLTNNLKISEGANSILNDRFKTLEQDAVSLASNLKISEELNSALNDQIKTLEKNIIALNKYQGVVDTEEVASKILKEAQEEATLMLENAKLELQTARKSAKSIREQATLDASTYIKNAENILKNATAEATITVQKANQKAEEIAGDAFKALQNVKDLENAAKAMKNIIEGYGEEYLKPTYSLIDDLAEEFKHTEAGEILKFSREKSQILIKEGMAAQCDYVETNRKETAIKFVLDAFNGKVDSILSKVKSDNYGILEQKIKDAYFIVNINGKAFRNAVITENYLNARLDELKWAVITQELKLQEQEEQRRIKEQIREEERARREFEKAIKDAQKEEETLKKLIEKAEREVAQANESQKAKFEAKLSELETRLKIAEEKNQRALSMAQQTKSGHVYIISNIGSFGEDVFKIGMTRRLEPLDRIRELGDASVPFEFDVHSMIYSDNAPALERELHKKFLRLQLNKVNPRKEFFKVTLTDIKSEVERLGLNVKWTMVAEAKQFRESLLIEEAIANDKEKQLEWEKYQLEAEALEIEEQMEVN